MNIDEEIERQMEKPADFKEILLIQRPLWFHQQKNPKEPFYNNIAVFRLYGELNVGHLEQVFNSIVQRHEVLRLSFIQIQDKIYQQIQPYRPMTILVIDLTQVEGDTEARARAFIRREAQVSFDLATGPLIKVKLYRLAPDQHWLVINMHHIVSDGWSWKILLQELTIGYNAHQLGAHAQLPSLPKTYDEFWRTRQHLYMQSSQMLADRDYWLRELKQVPELELGIARKRQVSSFDGEKNKKLLTNELAASIKQHSASLGVSAFIYYLSIFQLLIYAYSQQTDFGIGVPIAHRMDFDAEKLLGYFLNTVVVRARISDDGISFKDYVSQLMEHALDIYDHSQYPFENILEQVDFQRDMNKNPLFQLMFIYQDLKLPERDTSMHGLTFDYEEVDNGSSVFDMTFEIRESQQGKVTVLITYNFNIFHADDINQLLDNYVMLLQIASTNQQTSIKKLTSLVQFTKLNVAMEAIEIPSEPLITPSENDILTSQLGLNITRLWVEVLQLNTVDPRQSFFYQGGNSLLALKLIARLQALNLNVSLKDLFENPTIQKLTQYIYHTNNNLNTKIPDLVPAPPMEHYPLSFGQQRLWFLSLIQPDMIAYNAAGFLLLEGKLDQSALEKAINTILERHSCLRSVIKQQQGQPYQIIPDFVPVSLKVMVLESHGSNNILELMSQEANKPFDLSQGNLFRTILFSADNCRYYLFLCVHHIIFDGWSFAIFEEELRQLYLAYSTGKTNTLRELNYQYLDYVYWQQTKMSAIIDEQLVYWKTKLADLPVLLLPTDYPPSVEQSHRGRSQTLNIETELLNQLNHYCQEQHLTLFQMLLTAYFILMQRYSGQSDFAVSVPIAGRDHQELESLIGFFASVLIIRAFVDTGISFSELATRIQQVILEAYNYTQAPFEKLVSELQLDRDMSKSPLAQVAFNYVDTVSETLNFGENLQGQWHSLPIHGAKYDINIMIVNHKDHLSCELVYDCDLFSGETIAEFLQRYHYLLQQIVVQSEAEVFKLASQPDSSTVAGKIQQRERESLIIEDDGELTIPYQFAQQVKLHPQRLAVKTSATELSYQLLDYQSSQLAAGLLNLEHRPGKKQIAMYLEHDVNMVVAILGILKAGLVYVPLDYYYPQEWLDEILKAGEIAYVICSDSTKPAFKSNCNVIVINIDEIKQHPPSTFRLPMVQSDDDAYILFTSGSTGKPKGVYQNHRNILHHIQNYTQYLRINPNDGVLQLASYGFDAAVIDIFSTLLNGACLYPFKLREQGIPQLHQLLQNGEITIYHSTPSIFRTLLTNIPKNTIYNHIRRVVLGGEEVHQSDLQLFYHYFAKNSVFFNLFGATECSFSLMYPVPYPDNFQKITTAYRLPIGRLVDGVEALLIDDQGHPAEIVGELVYRSRFIALGYWQNPEFNHKKFKNIEGSKQRLYFTGDTMLRLSDGNYVSLGRKDKQVKIRGNRVEIGHIVSVLCSHSDVKSAVVLREHDPVLKDYLVAYLLTAPIGEKSAETFLKNSLLAFLQTKIPDYMIPLQWVFLTEFPLNAHGKLDYNQLQKLPKNNLTSVVNTSAPATELEQQLLKVWQEVLNISNVGLEDNFFQIGGHSLLMAILQVKIQDLFNTSFSIVSLFRFPTIRLFAGFLADSLSKLPAVETDGANTKLMQRKQHLSARHSKHQVRMDEYVRT
jgi:amino acid adenylation domain-containing protein